MEARLEATPQSQPGPERVARAREIGRGILGCLKTLTPERTLGVALYLQGHTAPQTARILGWSLKKAENMIYRGMADLRGCLEGKGLRP